MRITVGKDDYIKQIDITLPENVERIGVMLSGGADSAILLYLIALEHKMSNSTQTITPFTVARADGAWDYVSPIVDWINTKLDINLPRPIKVGDPTLHHSQQSRSGHQDAITLHNMQHVFYGSQAHPPVPMPGEYPQRPSVVYFPGTTCPFALVDKRHTLSLYKTFNVWPLIELTHSCTALTVGRCSECYNCKERAWALGALVFTDPGQK